MIGKKNCYVVAQQAGHMEVCDRSSRALYLTKKFPTLNTADEFKAARKVLIDYGDAEMLFREHVRDGIAKDVGEDEGLGEGRADDDFSGSTSRSSWTVTR